MEVRRVPSWLIPLIFGHQNRPSRRQVEFLLNKRHAVLLNQTWNDFFRWLIDILIVMQRAKLTRVHAEPVHLLHHFERTNLVVKNVTVEQSVELSHDSSFQHVDSVDWACIFRNNCRLFEPSTCKLIKIFARRHRKIHFRWDNRRCKCREALHNDKRVRNWKWAMVRKENEREPRQQQKK